MMQHDSLRTLAFAAIMTATSAALAQGSSVTPAISSGSDHNCALDTHGTVMCWGSNQSGQLGNGTIDAALKLDVIGLANGIAAVDGGDSHTCAVTAAGAAKCWGRNDFGQLGDGTSQTHTAPSDVAGLEGGAASIATGSQFTCAVTRAGGVRCWGSNDGQLGDGSFNDSASPVAVQGITNAVAVAAGTRHVCALASTGGVLCWGDNARGQLGDGTTATRTMPVNVSGLSAPAVAIAAGAAHACAILNTGAVKCWGANTYGQLGDGSTTDRLVPANVSGLGAGIQKVATKGHATCVLTNAGGVKCWGRNDYTELGSGYGPASHVPLDVQGMSVGVKSIAAGNAHFCALLNAGTMKCWGDNGSGQLGNSAGRNNGNPVDVVGISGAILAMGLGGSHTCAALLAGGVRCWGNNRFGQLGNESGNKIAGVVNGFSSGAAAVAAGDGYTCALTAAGGVRCWGSNQFGQLGDGSTIDRAVPADVLGLTSGMRLIASGRLQTCAATQGGGVKCWGLGYGTLIPLDVPGLASGVTAIAAGVGHACAVTASRGVKCWGNNESGQLGNGQSGAAASSRAAVDVVGLSSGVKSVAAGYAHSCALMADGGVKCWGSNNNGALGNGTAIDSPVPLDVKGLPARISTISASIPEGSTCAVTAIGSVACWGFIGKDIGNGLTGLPFVVLGRTDDVVNAAVGGVHVCAVVNGGGVICLGDNRSGEIGDGTLVAFRRRPESVVDPGGLRFMDLTPDDGLDDKRRSRFVAVTSRSGDVLTAYIQFDASDIGTPQQVYVFALAPASIVKNAAASALEKHLGAVTNATSKDAPLPCVLAQLNGSGQLTAANSSSLQAYLTGVLSAQGGSVTVLNGVSTALVQGAVFYVGYGPNPASMINSGTNRSVATFAGTQTCQPQAPQTGWWWNPAEGGRGFGIEMQGNHLFMAGYLYDATGRATWTTSGGYTSEDGSIYNGTLLNYTNGQTLTGPYRVPDAPSSLGPITLAFTDARHGTLIWPGGSIPIERFDSLLADSTATTAAFAPENGWWWNASESGRGYFMEFKSGIADVAGYMYDGSGNPLWYLSIGAMSNPQTFQNNWLQYANGQTLTGTYKAPGDPVAVGALSIQFQDAANATLTLPTGTQLPITRFRF